MFLNRHAPFLSGCTRKGVKDCHRRGRAFLPQAKSEGLSLAWLSCVSPYGDELVGRINPEAIDDVGNHLGMMVAEQFVPGLVLLLIDVGDVGRVIGTVKAFGLTVMVVPGTSPWTGLTLSRLKDTAHLLITSQIKKEKARTPTKKAMVASRERIIFTVDNSYGCRRTGNTARPLPVTARDRYLLR